MLQVARLAPRLLRDSSELVRGFLMAQIGDRGGFRDRDGRDDLYYTVFGIEGLLALQEAPPVERLVSYLRPFGAGDDLDLVHLASLARCDAALGRETLSDSDRRRIAERVTAFRSRDGGFQNEPGSDSGTVYSCFLAAGAYQDLGVGVPDTEAIAAFIETLRAPDGGYANDPRTTEGTTTATAAAVTLLRNFRRPPPDEAADWLLARACPRGGFLATPRTPMPDLLSTATALHALSGMERGFEALREPCLDFIDSLWTNRGGFHGHWADDRVDCEYTYYGLLALGHLGL